MQAANRILFLTENYSSLQGLKAVPIGLGVILIAWLENRATGPGRDIGLPLLLLAAALLAYEAIGRFYVRKFGRIRRSFTQRLPELILGIASALASYLAFWLDPQMESLGSPLGVTVAVLLLLDYVRTSRRAQGRYNQYMIVFAGLLFLLSILPALGVQHWWLALGFQSQALAILVALGILIVFTGVWGHLTLLKLLRESEVPSEPGV